MQRLRLRSSAIRYSNAGSSDDISNNPVGSRVKGLELDLHLREFEINQLTQRNNFFMIFQGVLIAGLVQSQGTAAPIITLSMSLLGLATSVLQVGMAGGAKYWQSRWEASTRSSEIALVLELVKRKKLAVQTFTHDTGLLSNPERARVKEWNDQQENEDDKIIDDPDYVKNIVKKDISSRRPWWCNPFDWLIRKVAIEPKWSVSRIPIWIGVFLSLFWLTIFFNSVHGKYSDSAAYSWIVPLKADESRQIAEDRKRLQELQKVQMEILQLQLETLKGSVPR